MKTASKPKFRKIDLSLKKLIGLCYATDELLQDSTALGGVIQEAFTSEFSFRTDDAILNGSGAGMPLGIIPSGALVSVAAEAGQASATINSLNIFKMWARLLPAAEKNAVWIVNKDVYPQLFSLNVAVGLGGIPVWLPAGSISGQPYSTLFGKIVIPCEASATLGTVGDVILADLGGYVLAEKGGIKSDMSIHVRYLYDESVFRFVLRIDGQPALASPITPFKGSSTLSHFVGLATRS